MMSGQLLDIKIDNKKLKRMEKMLKGVPGGMGKAVSRAINKSAMSARTQIARQVAAEIKVKVGSARKAVELKRATTKRWRADLGVDKKRIPLIDFAARQTKKGTTYQIDKEGGREKISDAFIRSVGSGHEGVFRRAGSITGDNSQGRLPIIQLQGPSIAVAFEGAKGLAQRITAAAYQDLGKKLDTQVELLLKRGK